MESAIEQARQAEAGEDSWPELSYLWTQHPIMEWLVDRLSSHFGRHQAPVIRSSEMNSGEQSFVMMAIIPKKKGNPFWSSGRLPHASQMGAMVSNPLILGGTSEIESRGAT